MTNLLSEFLLLLNTSPVFFLGWIVLVGLIIGSFLNVVIYRLPIMMQRQWRYDCTMFLAHDQSHPQNAGSAEQQPSTDQPYALPEIQHEPSFNLLTPRSRCSHCETPIKAWQNIPVLSYLLLRGRCHQCQVKISYRYPLIELFCALVSLVIAWHFGPTVSCFFALVLTWSLIVLTLIDIDHQLLPDSITLPLIWLGLIINAFGVFTTLHAALWGAVIGYLSLWSVFWAFKLITKKEGMGYGDFKLLAALGAFLGWQIILPTILIASIMGTLVGIILILKTEDNTSQPFAFGPYLALGGWLSMLYKTQLLNFLGF